MIAGTAGAIGDNANLTFDGSTLGVTGTVTALQQVQLLVVQVQQQVLH